VGAHVGKSVGPGDIVADKYRVERVIGKGAMGLVLAATDIKLGKGVALKCLLPHAWGNAAAVARFEREARAAGVLESEHVCRVLDVGRMPDGAPFIAMELLEGMDLAHELHRRGGRIPIPEAVTHVIEACDGIAEAHARGIIHRDLKPSNLFLAKRAHREPIIKVLDFGISKPTAVGQTPSALTGTADLLGSPLYMSPEQLRTPKGVDARADIWSLAATLYELLSGKAPFEGRTIADLASNIMNAPAPDVRRVLPNAPAGLAETLTRGLAKSRDARFATVADFARALVPFAHAKKTVPMPAVPPPSPVSSTKMLTTPISPPNTPREVNRTLPMAPGSVPALPSSPVAPPSDPSVATKAAAVAASPPKAVHSLAGPLGLFGSIVTGITIVVVIVVTRTTAGSKSTTPIASANASASSALASASSSAEAPTASASATPAASVSTLPPLEEDPDAAAPASSGSGTIPAAPSVQPVRPAPSASDLPDARLYNSAGY
jgi:eukaryotic-like serine/threonine-protein kinase